MGGASGHRRGRAVGAAHHVALVVLLAGCLDGAASASVLRTRSSGRSALQAHARAQETPAHREIPVQEAVNAAWYTSTASSILTPISLVLASTLDLAIAGRIVMMTLQAVGLDLQAKPKDTEVEFDVSLVPPSVLFMSSTLERKVSWSLIRGFTAQDQVVMPLIDAGLDTPQGLAYHSDTSALFVADFGQRKIFRYQVEVKPCQDHSCGGLAVQVSVKGLQQVMVEDVLTQFVSVDRAGNLYFTDEGRNTVCRIDAGAIQKMADRKVHAADLKRVPVEEVSGSNWKAGLPYIVTLYEAGESGLVKAPAGVDTDGVMLAFSNGDESGQGPGSLVSGLAWPKSHLEAHPISDGPPGLDVAITHAMTVYSSKTGLFGVCNRDGRTVALNQAVAPNGLTWDGDGTIYIADGSANKVFSLATGVCKENRPLTPVVSLHDVFGVALMKGTDPALAWAFSMSTHPLAGFFGLA
mmetsp:Transcript_110661/g.319691  ORF Transcript_110661/g.319691 Transcript_110661/m.319691 type:complete len:466 (-) Transcript_110661:177-1574(-)